MVGIEKETMVFAHRIMYRTISVFILLSFSRKRISCTWWGNGDCINSSVALVGIWEERGSGMINVILFLLSVALGFLAAWNIQQVEIDGLKEELKLEKAKVEFYKYRR